MGDLRVLRNVILHAKSVMRSDKHAELKQLGGLFAIDEPVALSYENMHKIFVAVKQDCGKLMLDWLGVEDAPIQPEEIADISIQKHHRPTQAYQAVSPDGGPCSLRSLSSPQVNGSARHTGLLNT